MTCRGCNDPDCPDRVRCEGCDAQPHPREAFEGRYGEWYCADCVPDCVRDDNDRESAYDAEEE